MATATFKPHFFLFALDICWTVPVMRVFQLKFPQAVNFHISLSHRPGYHLLIKRSRAWTTPLLQSAGALTFCNLWVWGRQDCDSSKVWDRTWDEGTPWSRSARSIMDPQLMSRIGDSTVPHMPNSIQNHSYFCSLTSLSMVSYLR